MVVAVCWGFVGRKVWLIVHRKPEAASDPTHPTLAALVTHWGTVIDAVALALPLIAVVGGVLMMALGVGAYASKSALRGLAELLAFYPVAVTIINWPFFLFARIVKTHLKSSWPEVRKIHWAGVGGLAGLVVPFLTSYVGVVFEGASHAPDAGQASGLFLYMVAPLVGGLLAAVGWFAGHEAAGQWAAHRQRRLSACTRRKAL